jgi:hypothetical protein
LGVPSVCLFDPDDLIMRKNELLVVNAILRLSRLAVKFGVAAPASVQFEMEIEQLEKEDKDARDKGEIEDDDDTDDTKTDTSAGSKDNSAPSSPNPEGETETETEDDKTDTESKADEGDKDEPEDNKPEDNKPADGTESAKTEAGSGKKLLTKNAKKKAQKKAWARQKSSLAQSKSKYVAEKGDEIDEALATMINTHSWDISIKRAVTKSKKKERGGKRRAKGEYKVGATKVFMRIVQGDLLVRWQADWVSLESFVQDRIAAEKK